MATATKKPKQQIEHVLDYPPLKERNDRGNDLARQIGALESRAEEIRDELANNNNSKAAITAAAQALLAGEDATPQSAATLNQEYHEIHRKLQVLNEARQINSEAGVKENLAAQRLMREQHADEQRELALDVLTAADRFLETLQAHDEFTDGMLKRGVGWGGPWITPLHPQITGAGPDFERLTYYVAELRNELHK